jgi:hypothetical protein
MHILLKVLVKKYNFKKQTILGKKENATGNEKPSDLRDELLVNPPFFRRCSLTFLHLSR